ncbi:MAG: hypothetical protein V1861_00350 [Candidatus Micrarchaeota archaeon]
MHRRRTSFGKALEEKGDFRRALGAYQNAGLIEDSQRMRSVIETIETAGKLERLGLYKRAVDMLLERGLAGEAKALSQRIGSDGVRESDYVLLRVLSAEQNVESMEGPAEHLMRLDGYARYLAGLSVFGAYPYVAEWIADGLSGKKMENEEQRCDKTGDKPESRMFFSAGNIREMTNSMISMMFMAMDSPAEMAYHAMRLYYRLGKTEDAARCLAIASASEELHFFSTLAKGGYEEVRTQGIHLDNRMRLIVAISDGHADMAVRAIERIGEAEEERLEIAMGILYDMEKMVPERLDTDSIFTLSAYMDGKRNALKEQNTQMLNEFKALIATGDLDGLKAGLKVLESIKFRYLDISYHDMKDACADAAMRIGTTDAVRLAASLYGNASEKRLECAEILLERGEAKEACEIFAKIAGSVSYDIYSERENHVTNPRSIEKKERLLRRAFSLEAIHPLISLSVYEGFREHDGAIRVAGTLLLSQNQVEVERAAWAVSGFDKRGMLMRDLLLRLESFGEDGKMRADGIRLEMRVPLLFVAKNGTG